MIFCRLRIRILPLKQFSCVTEREREREREKERERELLKKTLLSQSYISVTFSYSVVPV